MTGAPLLPCLPRSGHEVLGRRRLLCRQLQGAVRAHRGLPGGECHHRRGHHPALLLPGKPRACPRLGCLPWLQATLACLCESLSGRHDEIVGVLPTPVQPVAGFSPCPGPRLASHQPATTRSPCPTLQNIPINCNSNGDVQLPFGSAPYVGLGFAGEQAWRCRHAAGLAAFTHPALDVFNVPGLCTSLCTLAAAPRSTLCLTTPPCLASPPPPPPPVFGFIVVLELFGSPFLRNCEVVVALLFGYIVAIIASYDGKDVSRVATGAGASCLPMPEAGCAQGRQSPRPAEPWPARRNEVPACIRPLPHPSPPPPTSSPCSL